MIRPAGLPCHRARYSHTKTKDLETNSEMNQSRVLMSNRELNRRLNPYGRERLSPRGSKHREWRVWLCPTPELRRLRIFRRPVGDPPLLPDTFYRDIGCVLHTQFDRPVGRWQMWRCVPHIFASSSWSSNRHPRPWDPIFQRPLSLYEI